MPEKPITPRQALQELQGISRVAEKLCTGENLDDITAARVKKCSSTEEMHAVLSLRDALICAPNLFATATGKHDYITGKVGGLAKKRRQAVGDWSTTIDYKRGGHLMYPASRSSRPRGPDGGRSFHMSETIIHVTEHGSRSQKKARHHYTLDEGKVPLINAELAGQHLERGLYLSRPEVSTKHGDTILALTSMGPAEDEVVRQWHFIEEIERRRNGDPIERHLTIDRGKSTDAAFWNKAQDDAKAPERLRAFLSSGEKKHRFVGADSREIEVYLRKNGWNDRGKNKRPDITFHRGRNCIAQRRLVFELPADLDLVAIERIIHKLASEFRKRDLPFVLVVHRPDETNDIRNWHIHLDYHHRPMRRFDPATFVLEKVPPPQTVVGADGKKRKVGEKAYAQYLIRQNALAAADPSWTGKWDSEIEYVYRTASGKKKTCRPFLQDTHPDFREEGRWIKALRHKYADIINDELESVGSSERFDPRSFEERQIDKVPDAHLSSSKTRCERKGRPTLDGAMNEQCQWNYEVAELKKKFPGGDCPDGDPKAVSGFVLGMLDLVKKRLRSRSEFVFKYAARETNWDNFASPSPSSIRRNKRRDYGPEQLKLAADEMLNRIDYIWPSMTKVLANLVNRMSEVSIDDARLRTDAGIKTIQPRSEVAQQERLDRERSKPAQSAHFVRAPRRASSDNPSRQGVKPRTEINFDQVIDVLRKRDLKITLNQRLDSNLKKVLIARLTKSDAIRYQIPPEVLAQTPEQRAALMQLVDERAMRTQASLDHHKAASAIPLDLGKSIELPATQSQTTGTEIERSGWEKTGEVAKASKNRKTNPTRAAVTDQSKIASTILQKSADDAKRSSVATADELRDFIPVQHDGTGPREFRLTEDEMLAPGDSLVSKKRLPARSVTAVGSGKSTPAPVATQNPSHANTGLLTAQDIWRMDLRPCVLFRSDEGYRLQGAQMSQSLKAAATNASDREEFDRWFERQKRELIELTLLLARRGAKNLSDVEKEARAADEQSKFSRLWKRWNGTLLIDKALEKAISQKRPVEQTAESVDRRHSAQDRQQADPRVQSLHAQRFGPGFE